MRDTTSSASIMEVGYLSGVTLEGWQVYFSLCGARWNGRARGCRRHGTMKFRSANPWSIIRIVFVPDGIAGWLPGLFGMWCCTGACFIDTCSQIMDRTRFRWLRTVSVFTCITWIIRADGSPLRLRAVVGHRAAFDVFVFTFCGCIASCDSFRFLR